MAGQEPDRGVPEGAYCSEHPEQEASYTCPRCGCYACILCWRAQQKRCHACLLRDPTEAAAPIDWEFQDRPLLQRYLGTLLTALSPNASAPAFAHDDIEASLGFFLRSALPIAMLAGIIPHTRTLQFGGGFEVLLIGANHDAMHITIDVVRAMLVQAVVTGLMLSALLFPYVSLARAYGEPRRRHAALRVMFYRGWLIPASSLLFFLEVWAAPTQWLADLQLEQFMLLLAAPVACHVLLLVAMRSTLRFCCGLGVIVAWVVAIVPFVLLAVVTPLLSSGVAMVLPSAASATLP